MAVSELRVVVTTGLVTCVKMSVRNWSGKFSETSHLRDTHTCREFLPLTSQASQCWCRYAQRNTLQVFQDSATGVVRGRRPHSASVCVTGLSTGTSATSSTQRHGLSIATNARHTTSVACCRRSAPSTYKEARCWTKFPDYSQRDALAVRSERTYGICNVHHRRVSLSKDSELSFERIFWVCGCSKSPCRV